MNKNWTKKKIDKIEKIFTTDPMTFFMRPDLKLIDKKLSLCCTMLMLICRELDIKIDKEVKQ